jgi:hypothetical protein
VEVVSSPGSLTPAEYRHTFLREYRASLPDFALVPILFLYGLIFGNLFWDLVVGILVYVAFIVLVFPFVLWKIRPGSATARTIVLDDKGISIFNNSFVRQEEWARFSRSKERSEYFTLQLKNRKPSIIILKRLFDGPNDDADLRALLKAHTNAALHERNDDGTKSSQ